VTCRTRYRILRHHPSCRHSGDPVFIRFRIFVGVGLCFRSLNNLRHVNLGFTTRNVAILTADLQTAGFSEDQGRKLYAKMRETTSQMYGVESITLAGDIPVSQNEGNVEHIQAGDSLTRGEGGESTAFGMVDENYFSALGIPMLGDECLHRPIRPRAQKSLS
jgi:hypothetical protein